MSSLGKITSITGVTASVAFGAYLFHQRMSQVLEKNQFISEGLQAAAIPPSASLSYLKKVHMDDVNNVVFASLFADHRRVLITAKRQTQSLVPSETNSASSYYYDDDLDAQGTGLVYYWENPWEIKASAIRGFKTMKSSAKNFFLQTKAQLFGEVFSDPESEVSGDWVVTSVVVDDKTILGDATSHPEMAANHFSSINGQKSNYSIQRAKIVLSCLVGSVVLLGIRRTYLNRQMRPGYLFARRFIMSHPSVKNFYNNKEIEIISRSGDFRTSKIDAEITVGAREDSVEGIVRFGASKRKDGGWMVNTAIFTPNGAKPIDLLVRSE